MRVLIILAFSVVAADGDPMVTTTVLGATEVGGEVSIFLVVDGIIVESTFVETGDMETVDMDACDGFADAEDIIGSLADTAIVVGFVIAGDVSFAKSEN
jgi:hypothetical protein